MRNTAHRNEVSLCQSDIQQSRRLLGILKKHFVKVTQTKKEQGVGRQRPADALILLHHRRKIFRHHSRVKERIQPYKLGQNWGPHGQRVKRLNKYHPPPRRTIKPPPRFEKSQAKLQLCPRSKHETLPIPIHHYIRLQKTSPKLGQKNSPQFPKNCLADTIKMSEIPRPFCRKGLPPYFIRLEHRHSRPSQFFPQKRQDAGASFYPLRLGVSATFA